MKTRVVVTGMGAITPIGNDVESFWQALKDKTLGIGPITYFDTADFKCKLAAEVKDFDAKAYMDPKTARRMEPFSQFAVAAAKQALDQSGIDMEKEDPFRVGRQRRFRYWFPPGHGAQREEASGKRPQPCRTSVSSSDDLQYGCRKCSHPVWA